MSAIAVADRSACTARQHGTPNASKYHGCVCPDTREAVRLYRKRLREGRQPPGLVPAIGTRRRIQALMAIGWPAAEIARRLGWSHNKTLFETLGKEKVRRTTQSAVAALFDELSMTPGPSAITKGRARAAGHLPPLAWDDIDRDPEPPTAEPDSRDQVDVSAVARAVAGDPPENLRTADRREAVAELVRRRKTSPEIADRLGVTARLVERDRVTLRARKKNDQTAKTPDARPTSHSSACIRGNSHQSG
jgi:hypothetical protein